MKPAFGILEAVTDALRPTGIVLRGVAQYVEGEGPRLEDGGSARAVLLLGNVGGSIWPAFSAWRETQAEKGGDNPLDDWSKTVIRPVAREFGATAWFPSDPPYMPFQTWAARAQGLKASPLGILIHPQFGLWHGYRGALGFAETIAVEERMAVAFACDNCETKPCLTACPVNAVSASTFDVPACRSHLGVAAGQTGCMTAGCLARNACPVGREYAYAPEQLAFHMAALNR